MRRAEPVPDCAWTRTAPARAVREALVCGVFDAIVRAYARTAVTGRDGLAQLDGPAVVVANHASHVDTPLLLRALPGPRRRRTAVAAAADYFYRGRLLANAVSLAFCTVPLERGASGGERGAASLGALLDDGWTVVVFAEGTRSRDGRVAPLRTGAALLAAAHGAPIVPAHIGGTHAAMPVGRRWMSRPAGGGPLARHALRVAFGPPLHIRPRDDRYEAMERVRRFMAACGAATTPDPKLAARRAAAAAGAERAAAQERGTGERPAAEGAAGEGVERERAAGGRTAREGAR